MGGLGAFLVLLNPFESRYVVFVQMQKLNAQLGVAMQQAGQSSSQPMLLPQLLAANPQLQQQLPMMMSNALETVLSLTLAVVCCPANDLAAAAAAAAVSSEDNVLKTLVQTNAIWHFCPSLLEISRPGASAFLLWPAVIFNRFNLSCLALAREFSQT